MVVYVFGKHQQVTMEKFFLCVARCIHEPQMAPLTEGTFVVHRSRGPHRKDPNLIETLSYAPCCQQRYGEGTNKQPYKLH